MIKQRVNWITESPLPFRFFSVQEKKKNLGDNAEKLNDINGFAKTGVVLITVLCMLIVLCSDWGFFLVF
jgi:hypothetical protein